jgi:hypothetical protein
MAKPTFTSITDMPETLQRGTTAILGSKPEGRFGVKLVKNTPVYDSENAWMLTCVVTGRKFSPISVPAHFLAASVCDGKAFKKLQERNKKAK